MHEGAHQKFFDIAITRSILGQSGRRKGRATFAASWAGQPLTRAGRSNRQAR